MKFELHQHTKYSACSGLRVETIIKILKKKGYEGVAITDHDDMNSLSEVKKYAKKYNLKIIPSVEVNSTAGDILCYNLDKVPVTRDPIEIAKFVIKNKGFFAVAHPFDSHRGSAIKDEVLIKKLIKLGGYLELNARSGSKDVEKVLEFGKKNNAKFIAGSDSHSRLDLGKNATYLDKDYNVLNVEYNTNFLISIILLAYSHLRLIISKLFK
jgi:predicted metal-dependent phosphoesterase TrpH